MRSKADRAGAPSAAVGVLVAEHVLRVARVERKDRFAVTATAELRLPPGAVPDGRIRDVETMRGLLRRLWSELGLGFEPVVVGVGSPDVEVRAVDTTDDSTTRALVERARWLADGDGDALMVLPNEDADGLVLTALALRSTVQAAARAVEDAGIARPAVDAVPAALLRLARLLGTPGERIALVDGPVTWRVVLSAPQRSELDHVVADDDAAAPALLVDGEPVELGDRLGDVDIPEGVRRGLSTAALAVPVVLARQRILGLDLAPDLLGAPLSLSLGGHADAVEDAGAAWRAEHVGPLVPVGAGKRRRGG